MVLADRSGRSFNVSCQVAISCHITPPCYRHSSIIGAVFGEVAPATLPIIYHRRRGTGPINLIFGTVFTETKTTLRFSPLQLAFFFLNASPSGGQRCPFERSDVFLSECAQHEYSSKH